MNKVDCSQAYLDQLWGQIWADIGDEKAPLPSSPDAPTADPEAMEKKRKATYVVIKLSLKKAAEKYLESWQLTEEELHDLATAYTELTLWAFPDTGALGLFQWWQTIMDKYGPIIVAVQVTGVVVGSRLLMAYAEPPPETQDEPGKENATHE